MAPRSFTRCTEFGELVAMVVRLARRASCRTQRPTEPVAPLMKIRGLVVVVVGLVDGGGRLHCSNRACQAVRAETGIAAASVAGRLAGASASSDMVAREYSRREPGEG